jgi:hypothetical protein
MVLNNIRPIDKTMYVDLNAAGYNNVQKVEGLAVVDEQTIAVINDNDFGVRASITVNADGTFVLNPGYTPEPRTTRPHYDRPQQSLRCQRS